MVIFARRLDDSFYDSVVLFCKHESNKEIYYGHISAGINIIWLNREILQCHFARVIFLHDFVSFRHADDISGLLGDRPGSVYGP